MTLLHLQCQPKREIYVHVQSCYFYMSHLINLFLKVRFSGKEYVLMQPIDSFMDSSAVKSVLQAEYALLCIGNILKHEFDKQNVNKQYCECAYNSRDLFRNKCNTCAL